MRLGNTECLLGLPYRLLIDAYPKLYLFFRYVCCDHDHKLHKMNPDYVTEACVTLNPSWIYYFTDVFQVYNCTCLYG